MVQSLDGCSCKAAQMYAKLEVRCCRLKLVLSHFQSQAVGARQMCRAEKVLLNAMMPKHTSNSGQKTSTKVNRMVSAARH